MFGHYENLWLGRTEAISSQIETRTRAVTEQMESRMEQFASTLHNNSVTAAQALNDASGAAERTLVQVTNAAERTITNVSGETERSLGQVIGRFENLWVGRIDAINEHIDSRTKTVAEALDAPHDVVCRDHQGELDRGGPGRQPRLGRSRARRHHHPQRHRTLGRDASAPASPRRSSRAPPSSNAR